VRRKVQARDIFKSQFIQLKTGSSSSVGGKPIKKEVQVCLSISQTNDAEGNRKFLRPNILQSKCILVSLVAP
jgi:hypothetical protein